jgi:hypothetical protein
VLQAAHPGALAGAVAELETFLIQHFAREEQTGGIFDQIAVEQPERQGDIAALREEHQQILAHAQRLLEHNKKLAEEGETTIALGAAELVLAIERHEAHDADVMQIALAAR